MLLLLMMQLMLMLMRMLMLMPMPLLMLPLLLLLRRSLAQQWAAAPLLAWCDAGQDTHRQTNFCAPKQIAFVAHHRLLAPLPSLRLNNRIPIRCR